MYMKNLYTLYTENYETLLKALKEDWSQQTDKLCTWIRSPNIVKMAVLSKGI